MRWLCWICLGVIVAGWRVSAAEALPALADPQFDPAWKGLLDELGRVTARQSDFVEKRFFPFRKTPVELRGTIRLDPALGLSLEYSGAEAQTVIIDAHGLLSRDGHGHDQLAPDDARAQAFTHALVQVLHFDFAALQKTFAVFGDRTEPTWRLRFVPRDAALEKYFSALDATGEGGELRQIEISAGGHPRVQIAIERTRSDVIFPPEIIRRYFR